MTHEDALADAHSIIRARPDVLGVIYYHALSGRYVTKAADAPAPTASHWSRYSTVDAKGVETLEYAPFAGEEPAPPSDVHPIDPDAFASAFVAWLQKRKPALTVKDLKDADVMTTAVKQFLAETPAAISPAVLKALTNG